MKIIGTLFAIGLILTFPIHAQSAKVIALSPADAKEAKDLYAQRDAINKRIDDLQKKVTDKYLSDEKPGPGGFSGSGIISMRAGCFLSINNGQAEPSGCPPETETEKKLRLDREAAQKAEDAKKTHLERKSGWDQFEFSEDFQFVVPKTSVPLVNSYGYGNGCCNGIFSCIIPTGTIGTLTNQHLTDGMTN